MPNSRRLVLAWLVVAAGLVVAPRGVEATHARDDRPTAAATSTLPDERPVLWLARADRPRGEGETGSALAEAVASLLSLPAPSAECLEAVVIDDRAVLQVGLNLSALRRQSPELFLDDRLNSALHALGIANARELIMSVRPGADARRPLTTEVLVSYRSRPPGEFVRLALSLPGPRSAPGQGLGGDTGASETWIRPSWAVWLERCIVFHRATLPEADRPAFDASLRRWQAEKGPVVRGIFAALEGPIVVGGVPLGASGEPEPCVLIGLGSRADERTLLAMLPGAVEPVCAESTYDEASGIGRVRVGALAGTEFERLGWSIIAHAGRRWLLVTREGSIEAARGALADPRG